MTECAKNGWERMGVDGLVLFLIGEVEGERICK